MTAFISSNFLDTVVVIRIFHKYLYKYFSQISPLPHCKLEASLKWGVVMWFPWASEMWKLQVLVYDSSRPLCHHGGRWPSSFDDENLPVRTRPGSLLFQLSGTSLWLTVVHYVPSVMLGSQDTTGSHSSAEVPTPGRRETAKQLRVAESHSWLVNPVSGELKNEEKWWELLLPSKIWKKKIRKISFTRFSYNLLYT